MNLLHSTSSMFIEFKIAALSIFFGKEDFIRKSTKNYTTYKIYTYTCMYISPPATYANTVHNTKLIDIKHLSNGQLYTVSSFTYIRGLSKINANILGI